MAVDLLRDGGSDDSVVPLYQHEAGSIAWVLTYLYGEEGR